MSESETNSPAPDEEKNRPTRSPWVMITSMLLLIAGLLLCSIMMFHYAGKGAGSFGEGIPNIAELFKKASKLAPEAPKKLAAAIPQTHEEKGETTPSTLLNNVNKLRKPRLELTGFGTSADGTGGFAIINGEQILLNQTVSRIKLVEIRLHSVVVEYAGEQQELTVGN